MNPRGLIALAIMTVLGSGAWAASVSPIYSETSFDAATVSCKASGGAVVGHSMETTSADQNEFYVVACRRPVDGGSTFTVAWSASSFDDARNRCRTDSYTTGLPAGEPTGQPLYVRASQPDIFIVLCRK